MRKAVTHTMRSSNIHKSSVVLDGVHVDPDARVGPNCYLEGKIAIEAGATLRGGITLIGEIVVGRNAVLEPGVCIASPGPHKGSMPATVRIGSDSHVGAGTVLSSGVSIGSHSWIEPGTVVQRNIPPHAIVGGNPATISGYLDLAAPAANTVSMVASPGDAPSVAVSQVRGVTLHHFQRIRDLRGDLSVGEFERNVPFQPKRYFIVYDVPSTETRGEHAHIKCKQFLICVSGTVSIVADDGIRREEVLLDRPNIGLLIPAGIWAIQYKYSSNAVLLVFASEYYDPQDYIRNYDEFIKFRGLPHDSVP